MTGRNDNHNMLALLGGAALGAVAMYLMDPEAGEKRRETLGEAAGGALRGTGEALGTAWEHVSEGAATVGKSVAAGAAVAGASASQAATDFGRSNAVRGAGHQLHNAGDYLGELGHELLERARTLGARLSSGASDVGSNVADHSRSAASNVGSYFGYEKEEESHALGYTLGAIATAALGGAAVYFLDPQKGRSRRAVAGVQVSKIVGETGTAFRRAGQMCNDLVNRTKGTAYELQKSMTPEGFVPPEQLLQRVRSEMGHVVSNASQIQVTTDAEGNVTLNGRVLASELDGLLTTVKRVSGVKVVINRLDVADREDQMSGGQSSSQGSAIPQM